MTKASTHAGPIDLAEELIRPPSPGKLPVGPLMDPRQQLERIVGGEGHPPDRIQTLRQDIHQQLLRDSPEIDAPNFRRVSTHDLKTLFEHYDRSFFDGLLRQQAQHPRLTFRLSRRMTSTGGKTVVKRLRGRSELDFEIAVSTTLLFETFRDDAREVSVGGVPCRDRLDALQRILEHELVHLIEVWLWQGTSCAKPRFQGIARRLFGHEEHTHRLVTPRERATTRLGLTPGREVSFMFEGKRTRGIINRVTRRATVLVPDPEGDRYSDGKRYLKYYVPLDALEPASPPP